MNEEEEEAEVYYGIDPSKHFSKWYLDVWGPCIYKLYDIPRLQHQSVTVFEQRRQRTRLELYEPSISPIFKLPREILSIIIQSVPTECASVCALFWETSFKKKLWFFDSRSWINQIYNKRLGLHDEFKNT